MGVVIGYFVRVGIYVLILFGAWFDACTFDSPLLTWFDGNRVLISRRLKVSLSQDENCAHRCRLRWAAASAWEMYLVFGPI